MLGVVANKMPQDNVGIQERYHLAIQSRRDVLRDRLFRLVPKILSGKDRLGTLQYSSRLVNDTPGASKPNLTIVKNQCDLIALVDPKGFPYLRGNRYLPLAGNNCH